MRKLNIPPYVVAILSMPIAACSGASVTQSIQPQVELSSAAANAETAMQAPSVVAASPDNATLAGIISTPNPCYTLNASIEADGHDLTLTVTARSEPKMCVQMLGSFSYEARVTGLATGTYPMRVIYQYPGTGWETKEYTLQLRIP